MLPQPFDWIDIPAYPKWELAAYSIAKYPITNAQFAEFIEAGGYRENRWWTDAGWYFLEKEGWTHPNNWLDERLNSDLQPVVGVSWYEAVAFCLWLSEVTGERIMLPDEDQWEYAERDDDRRKYPWGNDWDGMAAAVTTVSMARHLGGQHLSPSMKGLATARSASSICSATSGSGV